MGRNRFSRMVFGGEFGAPRRRWRGPGRLALHLLGAVFLVLSSLPITVLFPPGSFLSPGAVAAAPADLDLSFGGTGKVFRAMGSQQSQAWAVALQPDGKIVAAGEASFSDHTEFAVARFNPDGSWDTTFGPGGMGGINTPIGFIDDRAHAMVIQSDGKIVLGGSSDNGTDYDFALVRYDANGFLDSTFGFFGTGKETTSLFDNDEIRALALAPDGKIVAAGYSASGPGTTYLSVVRYCPNGTVDDAVNCGGAGFGILGRASVSGTSGFSGASAVAVQPDGKIVAAHTAPLDIGGTGFGLVRFNVDGTLDTTFHNDGKTAISFGLSTVADPTGVAIVDGGKIVVGGTVNVAGHLQFGVARFNADGSFDTSFGSSGTGTAVSTIGTIRAEASALAVQENGKILVGGWAGLSGRMQFAVGRFQADGTVDAGFGTDGGVVMALGADADRVQALAVQPDGRIVAGGYAKPAGGNTQFSIARLQGDVVLPPPVGAPDKKLASAGRAPGTRVDSIAPGNDVIQGVAVQPDGKIVAAGYAAGGGGNDIALVRYHRDGSLDPSFGAWGIVTGDYSTGSLADDEFRAVTVDGNGKIVAAGVATPGANADFLLARYNGANGVLDPTFGSGGKVVTPIDTAGEAAWAVALQPDGKIVAAGVVNHPSAPSDFGLVRYCSDGRLDDGVNCGSPAFGTGGKVITDFNGGADEARGVAIQTDGKIVVAGFAAQAPGGAQHVAMARYDASGVLDPSFGTGGKVSAAIGDASEARGVAVQPDGKIVIGGSTTTGATSDFLAARYGGTDGAPDATFDGDGRALTDFGSGSNDRGHALALQTNGKIVVAGVSSSGGVPHFALARYTTSGTLDTSFNDTGTATTVVSANGDQANAVALQADGKIVSAGFAQGAGGTDFALVRYVGDPPPPAPVKLTVTQVSPTAPNPLPGTFSVTVRTEDLSGSPVDVGTDTTVTLYLRSGTGTLGGNPSGTIPTGSSSVTIANLTYSKAETGVVLRADDDGDPNLAAGYDTALALVDSQPFNVVNPQFTLTVTTTGNGAVTSSPAGITCGATCSALFDVGTSVTLTAAPGAGQMLTGWGGACSGAAGCTVVMDGARSVSASFALQSLTVNSATDAVDATPGDGLCATAAGECTLRAAIMEANARAGADTVFFSSALNGIPLTLTIPPDSTPNDAADGDLDIKVTSTAGGLTITGNGAANTIIRACTVHQKTATCPAGSGIRDRVFDVITSFGATGQVTISGVTLRNGRNPSSSSWAGALSVDLYSTVSLVDSELRDNFAAGGGAISSNGTLTVTRTVLSGNQASGDAGAINNGGTLTLTAAILNGNRAGGEGGAITNGGTLTATDVTFSGNLVSGSGEFSRGGALASYGTLTMTGATIDGNTAGVGGGILHGGEASAQLANVTVSGNTATDGQGGGIFVEDLSTLTLASVTVFGNSATSGTAGQGGGLANPMGTVTLKNTILAGNQAAAGGPDCQGALTSTGYNLLGDSSGCTGLTNGANGDKVGSAGAVLDPKLAALAANGGPTRTHALLTGSPAIDAVAAGSCTDLQATPQTVTVDQRGTTRPQGPTCDIGAFELVPAALSNNANLSILTISAGTLSPSFAAGTIAYTASVPNATASITVTPTAADSNATIQVRVNTGTFSAVVSGSASGPLALNVGSNTVEVKVTAQDGTMVKTYTVTVTRAAAGVNGDFEIDVVGTADSAITGWNLDFYSFNDFGTRGSSPRGVHELFVSGTRYFSGTKSVYSRVQNVAGGGPTDADGRHSTSDLVTEVPIATTAASFTLWRTAISYTTSSRWYHRLDVELGDGTTTQGVELSCRAWGNGEGCAGNFQDHSDLTAAGADGQTWYRYTIPIPAGMNKSNLTVKVRHQQDSWDGTTAESSLYYDLFAEVAPLPTKLAITNINPPNPIVGESFSVTVQPQGASGAAANVAQDTVVDLRVKNGAGILVVPAATARTIAAGTSEKVISGVTYSQAGTGVVLEADDDTTPDQATETGLTPGVSPTFTVFANACVAPPTGLVSWWAGDGNASDIKDGNNGTPQNGATFATGKVGQAFSLDGVDDAIVVPHNINLNPSGAFTVDAWFNADPSQNQALFALVDKSHGFTDGTGWVLSGTDAPAGAMAFGVGLGGANPASFAAVTTGVSVKDGQWHHVAGVFTGNALEIYLDGVLRETAAHTTPVAGNTRDLLLGRSWGGGVPQRHFRGLVDEVEVFNRALTAAEVQSIYLAGSLGKCRLTASVQFSAATYSVNENAGTVTIGVTRTGDTSGTSSVVVSTVAASGTGVATENVDYTPISNTVTFQPNDTAKTTTVTIVDDSVSEGNETVSLTLTAASGAVLGTQAAAMLTILDDELAATGNRVHAELTLGNWHFTDADSITNTALTWDRQWFANIINTPDSPAGAAVLDPRVQVTTTRNLVNPQPPFTSSGGGVYTWDYTGTSIPELSSLPLSAREAAPNDTLTAAPRFSAARSVSATLLSDATTQQTVTVTFTLQEALPAGVNSLHVVIGQGPHATQGQPSVTTSVVSQDAVEGWTASSDGVQARWNIDPSAASIVGTTYTFTATLNSTKSAGLTAPVIFKPRVLVLYSRWQPLATTTGTAVTIATPQEYTPGVSATLTAANAVDWNPAFSDNRFDFLFGQVLQGAAPTFTLSPGQGVPGATVTVTGSGYLPNATVELRLDSATGLLLNTATSGGDGSLSTTFAIPQITAKGPHAVEAVVSGAVVASAGFTITPHISGISPDFGPAGTQVTITGLGFGADPGAGNRGTPGHRVSVDGRLPIPDADVLSWGDNQITIRIPTSLPAPASGGIQVTAAGVRTDKACFRVSDTQGPCVYSDFDYARPGWRVHFIGERFPANQAVTATWDGISITPNPSSVTTDAQGRFGVDTEVIVALPNNATVGPHKIQVSAGGQSDKTQMYVYSAITCVSPASGGPGTLVTITGKDFGAGQGGNWVSFTRGDGSTSRGQVQSWSNTQITVKAPFDVATGYVFVRVDGLGVGAPFSVGAPPSTPTITCISPDTGGPGTPVTITGYGFGASQGSNGVYFAGSGSPNQPLAASVTSWSDTSITVTVPENAVNGRVGVGNIYQFGNTVPFEVIASSGGAPQLSLAPDHGRAGTVTTVTGTNFTPGQQLDGHALDGSYGLSAPFTVGADGTFSHSVTIPAWASPGKHTIGARTVSGVPMQSATFKVTPYIEGLTPSFVQEGTSVTIAGLGFGPDPGATDPRFGRTRINRIVFGDEPVPSGNVQSWSDTAIVFTVPTPPAAQPSLLSGAVRVTADRIGSNAACFRVAAGDGPCVLVRGERPGMPGTATGERFQPGETVTLSWDGPTSLLTTTPAVVAADAEGRFRVDFTIPLDAAMGRHVLLAATAGSVVASTHVAVTPALTCISPASGSGGATVTLTGRAFGGSQGPGMVNFEVTGGAVAQGSVVSWSDTQIVVTAPSDVVTGWIAVVGVQGVGSNPIYFTAAAALTSPHITCVQPDGGGAGTQVTITGINFGPDPGPGNRASFLDRVRIFGSADPVPDANIVSWNETQIVFTMPAGVVSNSLAMRAGGVDSLNSVPITTLGPAPSIVSFTPTGGPPGTSVTITGTGFTGATGVKFGPTSATSFTVDSDTQVTATVPSGALSGAIYVTTPAGTGISNSSFAVAPPPAITLSPASGRPLLSVNVSGGGFAPNEIVMLHWDGIGHGTTPCDAFGTMLTQTNASGTGAVNLAATVPACAGPGNHTLLAIGSTQTATAVFNVSGAAAGPVLISVEPQSATVGVNVTVDVAIRVQGGVQEVDGIETFLTFNPALVEVVDLNPAAEFPGVQVLPGDCPLPAESANTVDNVSGTIHFARGIQLPAGGGASQPVTVADCTLGTVRFKGKAAGTSPVHLALAPGEFPATKVVLNEVLVPFTATDGTVPVIGKALVFTSQPVKGAHTFNLGIQPVVVLQENGVTVTTDSTTVVTLRIKTDTGTPGATLSCIDGAGNNKDQDLVTPGIQKTVVSGVATFMDCKIDLKGQGYVLEAVANGAGIGMAVTQPFGVAWGGDANHDCLVDIVDFSVLVRSFAKQLGDLGYDARADLNGDNKVDVLDFSVLVTMFGTRCPSLTASASSSGGDTVVTLVGSTYGANRQVTVTLDGAVVTTSPSPLKALGTGGFEASFTVAGGLAQGAHVVKASQQNGRVIGAAVLTVP